MTPEPADEKTPVRIAVLKQNIEAGLEQRDSLLQRLIGALNGLAEDVSKVGKTLPDGSDDVDR